MTPKEIKGYNGYLIYPDGRVFSKKTNKFLKPSKDKQGYLRIGLYKNKKTKTIKIQRLVAEAFLPNKDNKIDVNHIDGNKENNTISNLEWATRSENIKHAFKNKLKTITKKQIYKFTQMTKKQVGSKNPASVKVIDTETNKIFDTVTEASNYIGLKRTTLIAMLKGQNPNKTKLKYYE